MTSRRVAWWNHFRTIFPRFGKAGSRSALLHNPDAEYRHASLLVTTATGVDLISPNRDGSVRVSGPDRSRSNPYQLPTLTFSELRRFAFLRWLGTLGALLLGFGGLGAGAMPVMNNPYEDFPGGALITRMLQTSTALCFIGIGLIVVAWLVMAPFTGVTLRHGRPHAGVLSMSMIRRTFVAWTLPIVVGAPLFTQDIYSYLANGSIVVQGLDPYSAGPIDLLGTENLLARSVPLIWAHSPSPYGPVALGAAAVISWVTNDSVVAGVFAHRLLALGCVALIGWAVVQLARRCGVIPQAAVWLGVLNPLTILHLVGGIHNEAILLGLLLVGVELGLRGADRVRLDLVAIGIGVAAQVLVLVLSVVVVTWVTGIGVGWISGQGGATTIRSWLSFTTAIGVSFGWIGQMLKLGDHTEAILLVTRSVGVLIAGWLMVRMLLATYLGRISPVGALGVSTFVMVVFFPVVHPWYALWAILPLSAWANRPFFRTTVVVYSTILSFFVLPRGLGLVPGTVVWIYVAAVIGFATILGVSYVILKRRGVIGLN